jgi:hypothetical protein
MKQSNKLFSMFLRDSCGQETDRLAGFLQLLNREVRSELYDVYILYTPFSLFSPSGDVQI